MNATEVLSGALGISTPWRITQVGFTKDSSRLDLSLEIVEGLSVTCPNCGLLGNICYPDSGYETWYKADFFRYTTYLHARVPHLACRCGISPLELPWCRAGSRFTLLH
jgi:hypothetical protein